MIFISSYRSRDRLSIKSKIFPKYCNTAKKPGKGLQNPTQPLVLLRWGTSLRVRPRDNLSVGTTANLQGAHLP